ncbi:ExbD/TolR family protein [Poriferisphaera sp. WC338]|uniref:ExbD/TolR family protein n=1 Tax=Poriferisphaera sp. WC338 TaxID=3425129 RepID=UPI003D81B35D
MAKRYVRRTEQGARLEMTPMIDVVFLLLTFFIYTLVVRVEFLPVALAGVNTGEKLVETEVVAITIDRGGRYFVNREPLGEAAFEMKLREIGGMEKQPLVVVAMQVEEGTDGSEWLMGAVEDIEGEDAAEGADKLVREEGEGVDVVPSERAGDAVKAVDRGPLVLKLIQMMQGAGIKDFRFAGPPRK